MKNPDTIPLDVRGNEQGTSTSTPPDLTLFLASSFHDMKNSLSVLLGGLEKVLDKADPQRFPEYASVSQMMYETRRINGNLVALLTLYKLGNHSYPFDPADHSIEDFLTVVAAQNAAMLAAHSIDITIDCPPGLFGHFDEDLVGGVIGHALNNAIKYTRQRINLVAREVDNFVELRIEDDGPGFPDKMIQEGLDAMRGINFQSGSTGLGLIFSAAVAKLHRNRARSGEIRLENGGTLGGGCLILRLP